MIAKRLFDMLTKQNNKDHGCTSSCLHLEVGIHYGVPYTSSILAFDPVQRLLAIGTLDGRIKVIGGDNIEGLLKCPKKVPYKYLEFLHNQGFIVAVTNENEVQVWNLEFRHLVHCLQWEVNVTAFSVIHGTYLMYVGDENGLLSVLKYDEEDGKFLKLPYQLSPDALAEADEISFSGTQSIIGILPQPDISTRVLVAYEKGLLILWDTYKKQAVCTRGNMNLKLKSADSSSETGDQLDSYIVNLEEENEICSLCWVSASSSIVAAGYINGDVLLWDFTLSSSVKGQQPMVSSKNVIKMQLASGVRRLPVIVLQWSANSKGNNDKSGQLFVYGGDEIGSEEVLAVLTLEWSSGVESLRCISRVNLKLNGSFADMILIPSVSVSEKSTTDALFVLTNPGQLNVYDGTILSLLKSDEDPSARAENFPVVIPAIDPDITVTKLSLLPMGDNSSKILLKKFHVRTTPSCTLSAGTKWPLTGGVPPEFSSEDYEIEKIFICGYQDGSVRIWDATYPVLAPMFVLEGKLPAMEVDVVSAAVSAVAICSLTMTLAIGNECGLVRIYKLQENFNGSSFHFVTETNHEVHMVHHGQGFHCIAAFSIVNSPVQTIRFVNSGGSFAVGFQSGQVLMLDITSLSVLFRTDCTSGTNSAVISASTHVISQEILPVSSPKQPDPHNPSPKEVLLTLTRDSQISIIACNTGDIICSKVVQPNKESVAISMHVIEGSISASKAVNNPEKCPQNLPDETSSQHGTQKIDNQEPCETKEPQGHYAGDVPYPCEILTDPRLVLCFSDSLCLYSLKSMMEENNNFINKVNLPQRVCWSMPLKVDGKVSGVIILFETGTIELRCLPNLEVTAENSLMSILRWSFKTNMDRTMSSSDDGLIALVNGCEVAFLSLDNKSRFAESLPCLHDKVLAAAAAAAINQAIDLKKKQSSISPGIFGGIIRGLRGANSDMNDINSDNVPNYSSTKELEELFSRSPFRDQRTPIFEDGEVIELNIDDIVIDDDPLPIPSTSTNVKKITKKDEAKEREKLFQGATKDIKPRTRTTQEILTQYKFNGDAAAAAAHAKEKLTLRQEKLDRISERTAELENNAENFASMAHELAKAMENKKWWKL